MSADRLLLTQVNFEDGLANAIVELRQDYGQKPILFFYPEGNIPKDTVSERLKITAILHACAQLSYLDESQNGQIQNVAQIEERLKGLIQKLKSGETIEIPGVIANSYIKNPQSFLKLTPERLAPHW